MLTLKQIEKIAVMLEQTGGRDGYSLSEYMSLRIDRDRALAEASIETSEIKLPQVEESRKEVTSHRIFEVRLDIRWYAIHA